MTFTLTDELRQALDESNGLGPVTVIDAETQTSYVLLRGDLFERFRALLSDTSFDAREAYPLMDAVASAEGWLDPEMDAYDALDPRKP